MAVDAEFEERERSVAAGKTPLGQTLMALRKRERLSQQALAVRLGTHRQVIQRMERRPEVSSVETFSRVTEALGEPAWKVLKFAAQLKNEKPPQ